MKTALGQHNGKKSCPITKGIQDLTRMPLAWFGVHEIIMGSFPVVGGYTGDYLLGLKPGHG